MIRFNQSLIALLSLVVVGALVQRGSAIAPLLNQLVAGQTVLELMQQWSKQQDLATCWQVLQWLWFQHIIVRITEGVYEKTARTNTSRA